MFRLWTQAFDERVAVLAGGRQELFEVDATGRELSSGALDAAAQIGVDKRLRRLDVGELDELSRRPPDQLVARALQLGLAEAPAYGFRPRGDGVELTDVLPHPVVGELGGHELLDTGDLDRHVDRLSGALGRRRERALIPWRDADEVVVEVVGHPPLADLVGPVVGIQPRYRFPVTGAGEVDDDVVANRRRTLDVVQRAEPLQLGSDLGVDLLVGDGYR